MIECPVCHKKVSEFATECPNCHAIITKKQGKVSAFKGNDTEEIVTRMNKSSFVQLLVNIILALVIMIVVTGITNVPIPNANTLFLRIMGYTVLFTCSCINVKANNIRLPKKSISIATLVIVAIVTLIYTTVIRTHLFGSVSMSMFQYYPMGLRILYIIEIIFRIVIIDLIVLEICSAIGLKKNK